MSRQAKQKRNPFVGPVPLQRGEPFYGRARELSELRNLVVAERIVVLYSPSGAGKTSLIQAGLVEMMEQEEFNVLPVISLIRPPGADETTGGNRFLQSTIISLEGENSDAEERAISKLARMHLPDYLEKRSRASDAPSADVLIFDQFEQFFTLDPADSKAKTDFFKDVGEALRAGNRWALFSLREDHLAELDPYRRWIPQRLATTFRLEYLSLDEAREAICLTARCGEVDVDEKAADLLIEDLSRVRVQQPDGSISEDQGTDIEPVQLQVVCHRLLELLPENKKRLDRAFVKSHGDVEDALREYYAETVSRVAKITGVSERNIRAWFDEQLITKQRIRGQVLQGQNESEGLEASAVQELIEANLVRQESARGAPWLELAHDRLIEPILESNNRWYQRHLNDIQLQARIWERQDRATGFLITGDALAKAKEWAKDNEGALTPSEHEFLKESEDQDRLYAAEQKAREEAQKALKEAEDRANERQEYARRLWRWFLAVVVVGLLALAFAVVALRSWHMANINGIRTLASLSTSEDLRGDNERGSLLARQAYLDQQALVPSATVEEVNPALGRFLGADHFNHVFRGHLGRVLAVTFDQSGDHLVSAGSDGTVRLWDPTNTESKGEALPPGHPSGASVVAIQPGGPWIASGGDDENVLVQIPGAPESDKVLSHKMAVRAMAFDPDQNILATAGRENRLRLWDPERPEAPIYISPEPPKSSVSIRALEFRPDHRQLFTADTDGNIVQWDLGEPGAAIDAHPTPFAHDENKAEIWDLAFSPNGEILLSVGADGRINLWDPDDPQKSHHELATSLGFLRSVEFSHDGNWLATGGDDGLVRIWNIEGLNFSRELPAPQVLRGHRGPLNSVGFDRGDGLIASAGDDGTIRLWEMGDPAALPLGDAPLSGFALAPDRTTIAVAGRVSGPMQGLIQLWDLHQSKEPLPGSRVDESPFSALAFDVQQRHLASGGTNGTVRLWSLESADLGGRALNGAHTGRVTDLAFSPDGELLVSSGNDGNLHVWQTVNPDGKPDVAYFQTTGESQDSGDAKAITSVVFAPDGNWLAASGAEGLIGIWTDRTRFLEKPDVVFQAHEGRTTDMVIDPQRRWLATAGVDGTVNLWDVDQLPAAKNNAKTEPAHKFDPLGGGIVSIAFTKEGNTLAAASDDGSIWLWDFAQSAGNPSRRLLISDELGIESIAFDDNGKLVVVSGTAVREWETDPDVLADTVCDKVYRDLTTDEWVQYVDHDPITDLIQILRGVPNVCPESASNSGASLPQANIALPTAP